MINKTPLFSIVIPTFNHGHLIGRCLDSVLTQSYDNWEAIVVNNFSEDNTIGTVYSYNDPRINLVNNANGGIIAVSRNKGISMAQGEWICFLDADDWWTPNKLEECLPHLNDYDLIYHDLNRYDNKGIILGRKIKGRELSQNIIRDLMVNGNGIPNSSVVVRSSILQKIHGFEEKKEFVAIEDSDCWLRIAEITNRFKYIPKTLGAYWIGGNVSVSIKQIEREQMLLNSHIHKLNIKDQKLASKNLKYKQARIYHKLSMFKQARKAYMLSIEIDSFFRDCSSILLSFISIFRIKI